MFLTSGFVREDPDPTSFKDILPHFQSIVKHLPQRVRLWNMKDGCAFTDFTAFTILPLVLWNVDPSGDFHPMLAFPDMPALRLPSMVSQDVLPRDDLILWNSFFHKPHENRKVV